MTNRIDISTKNQVNGIFINNNRTLLSFATNSGYRIYSLSSFALLNEEDDDNDVNATIGAIKIAIPFYQSELVFLVGKSQTSTIKDSQLVIWNDKKKSQFAMLNFTSFTSQIAAIAAIRDAIFIAFNNRIEVYETSSLKQIAVINDVCYEAKNRIEIAFTQINEPICNVITICDIECGNKSNIKINRFLSEKGAITQRCEETIPSPFNSIYRIAIDSKGKFASIIAENDNHVHIYDLLAKKLLYCFDIEKKYTRINNIGINANFVFVFYADNFLDIYLPKKKKCDCINSKEIAEKIVPFAKYKFRYRYIDELVTMNLGSENNNLFLVYFTKKSEIDLIDAHGICQKIKFNSKMNDDIWCYKEIKFKNNFY